MKLLQIGNIYVLQKHIKVLLLPDMLKSYIQPIWVCYFPLVFTNVYKARSINIYINGYKTHKQMPFKTNVCGINYWSPSTISLGSMIYKTLSPSSSTVEDIKPTFGHFPLMTGNSFLGRTPATVQNGVKANARPLPPCPQPGRESLWAHSCLPVWPTQVSRPMRAASPLTQ